MKYVEYTKVSVHNHMGGTESERRIDESYEKKLVFNFEHACSIIDDAYDNEYSLLALTNANVFNVQHYIMTKFYARQKGIELIPGVELNIVNKTKKKYLHLVLLIDPNANLLTFEKKLESLIRINKKNYITIDQLVDLIIKNKVILIPHGLKQSDEKKPLKDKSASGNVEQLKEIISMDEAFPIVLEDSKSYYKETLKMKIKNQLSSKEIFWLDNSKSVSAADRRSFSMITSPTYIWGENSFDDLFFAAIMKGSRIKREEDIIIKTSYISKIEIEPQKERPQIEKSVIECSHGLNSIIGKSGSGKTLLLNAIKLYLTDQNLFSKTSSVSQYNNIYEDVKIKLYDACGKEIVNKKKWKVFEGANLYNKILQAYSGDKSSLIRELDLKINDNKFKNIIEIFSNKLTNYCQNSIKVDELNEDIDKNCATLLSNINFLKENKAITTKSINYLIDANIENKNIDIIREIKKTRKDLSEFEEMSRKIEKIIIKYCTETEKNNYKKIKKEIIRNIEKKIKELLLVYSDLKEKFYIKRKLFEVVKTYNATLGKKIEVIMNKNQDNLRLVETIREQIKSVIFLKETLCIPTLKKDNFENVLRLEKNDISNLIIKNKKMSFNLNELNIIFDSCVGMAKNKLKIKDFDKYKIKNINLNNKKSMHEFLNVFIQNKYKYNIELNYDYNNFIEYELQLKNSNNKYENIETMSAGELSKTYINNMLDKQINDGGSNLIILFDQPDNNLEKKFILNDLVTKINELRNHYQVFITTHEPLLVVNADSNCIIEAQNEKSAVSKKNKIKYRNLSFVKNATTKTDMVIRISELVDGSYNAIKERNKIYGGMLNENIN